MSVQKSVLDGLATAINALNPFATVVFGSMPQGNALAMLPAGGAIDETTLAHGCTYGMVLALNCRHTNQGTAIDTLATIHEALNKTLTYPSGTGWQVIGIQSNGQPAHVDYDGTYWLYGSSLTVRYCIE